MTAKGIDSRLTKIENAVSQRRLDEPSAMPSEERWAFARERANEIAEGKRDCARARFDELLGVNRQCVRNLLHYFSVCGRLPKDSARLIADWLNEQGLRVV